MFNLLRFFVVAAFMAVVAAYSSSSTNKQSNWALSATVISRPTTTTPRVNYAPWQKAGEVKKSSSQSWGSSSTPSSRSTVATSPVVTSWGSNPSGRTTSAQTSFISTSSRPTGSKIISKEGRMKYAPFQKNMDLMKAALLQTSSLSESVAANVVTPVVNTQSWGKSPNGASRIQVSAPKYQASSQTVSSSSGSGKMKYAPFQKSLDQMKAKIGGSASVPITASVPAAPSRATISKPAVSKANYAPWQKSVEAMRASVGASQGSVNISVPPRRKLF